MIIPTMAQLQGIAWQRPVPGSVNGRAIPGHMNGRLRYGGCTENTGGTIHGVTSVRAMGTA